MSVYGLVSNFVNKIAYTQDTSSSVDCEAQRNEIAEMRNNEHYFQNL